MAYKVLYRKYRPDTFNKIIGQDNIVKTLKNSIINNNFSHAYIFTGPRGTGKTSTAKVFAKTINCESIVDGESCGNCKSCNDFNSSTDIIEIDAASNNGVDEIRELRNNVSLTPSSSKYKIYIIDEVHMLTPSAFNALLKTLEEPPSHVIFILATTEIYKVPITILSRCQRFDFKKVNNVEMINHLKKICDLENIDYEDEALNEIYLISEGCVRDALSILDQTSKYEHKITYEMLIKDYNMISLNIIKELIDYCFIGDDEKLISKVNEFEKNGVNIQQLIKNMINYLDDYALKNARKDYILFEKIKRLVFDLDNCYIEARTNENSYNILKLILLDFTFSFSDKKINKQEEKITKNDSQKLELRINNAFAGAKKSFLNSALKTWQDTDFTEFSLVNLNLFLPVVASDKYVIFSCDDDNMVNLFNSNLSDIEKELIKKGVKFRVYSITNNYWQEIKKDYIKNIKNGYRYELVEEKEIIDKPKETKKGKINELFDNSEIKIIEKEGNDK